MFFGDGKIKRCIRVANPRMQQRFQSAYNLMSIIRSKDLEAATLSRKELEFEGISLNDLLTRVIIRFVILQCCCGLVRLML